MPKHVVVIGAGIVGVSSAIWLRRAGCDVTLIDRLGPGKGTSHGNAGVLAAGGIVPLTTPGLKKNAIGHLFDRNFPLFLRWGYLPRMLPWLRSYLSHAEDSKTRRIAQGLMPIVSDAVEQHKALCDDLGLGHWVTDSDYCYAYQDRMAFNADAYGWDLRAEHGFIPQVLDGPEVQEYEPTLSPEMKCLAIFAQHGFIRDPGGYVAALAEAFRATGGNVMQADLRDVDVSGGKVSGVETDSGRIDCDSVLLATGVWSKPLMAKLGVRVPLESERGYHIVFKGAQGGPSRPIMVASGKFVATPMAAGVRCAGIVEFGGLKAGPSKAPFEYLRKHARAAFPWMDAVEEIEWMGHRPAPTDSLPFVGEVGETGVFTAFGHHHIGLTGGPKTGRLVAGMIAGNPPNVDMAPYHPQRFN